MDAPLGLEPRFAPSKGDVLPLDEGATFNFVYILYMLYIALSNILDARLGLEPRTY